MAKERLDALLVKRNLVQSRERAKTTIMAGLVLRFLRADYLHIAS